jgi:protein-tyrosine phosphatase
MIIDIHSHILPGVDDGAVDLPESLAMARLAVERGTAVQFATPHVTNRLEFALAESVAARVAELQAVLDTEGIPLRLVPGAEVYPMEGLAQAVDDGVPLTLTHGGKYLLLDSPFSSLPMGLGQMIYLLQTRGVTPILAHPERVMPIQQNPQLLEEYVHRGLLLQVNTSSVLGRHGEEAQATAHLLLRHRWVHFLASDSHGIRSRRPGLADAAATLADAYGQELVDTLTQVNGQHILDGTPVLTDPLPYTPPPKKNGWFARLFGRR